MLTGLMNVVRSPDLRKKVLFTLFILVVFRIGSILPVPNVNVTRLNECLEVAQGGDNAQLYSMINMFSGGALLQLAVFALGIMPYITASIILQIMTVVVPRLATLKKEGASGQAKITQYTRYLTLVLAILNGTGIVMMAVNGQLLGSCDGIVYDQGIFSIVIMILVMTAGTGIVMWLGELITERGVGNGMSVLIFTQIIARFPGQLWAIKTANSTGADAGFFLFFLVIGIGLLVMLAVLFMEQGQRRIPVQYAKRMVGRKMYGGSKTYIPLKVNQSGVIPVIFASSLLYIPRLFSMMWTVDKERDNWGDKLALWVNNNFIKGDHPVYNLLYALLIIAFCYFYISITFNPEEMADNMKKYGGFIPGIRAGLPTQKYIAYVLSRLTAPGSLYLALVALIPTVAIILINADQQFPFGGTSILIVVGVGLDTVKQIQSQLEQRSYEGFLK
ncbi:MAG: preprotein translocase subunit SecY [Propionibacteriaceae bacterium]|jgi:preprotein translocase subunit SecY|nr:preprotein translocase subunit SecY [Propionibacteriaceae bacterium]